MVALRAPGGNAMSYNHGQAGAPLPPQVMLPHASQHNAPPRHNGTLQHAPPKNELPPAYRLLSQPPTFRYPRAPTPQQRGECYHPVSGGGYMSGAVPGAPNMQAVRDMRPTSQSPATTQPGLPQPPPDIKQSMQQHQLGYTSQPQPSQQGPRPQMYSSQYRHQGAPRPTHSGESMRYFPRHEHQHSPSLYQGGGPAQVMYASMLHPSYTVMPQQYPQQRQAPCYTPQNMILHQNYCISQYPQNQGPQHSAYYYPPAGAASLLPSNLSSPAGAGRNTATLGPSPLQPAAQPHLQNVTAPRLMTPPSSQQQTRKPRIYAVIIQDPKTGAVVETYADNNQTASGESSARQTPQPEHHTNSVAEEFSRMVTDSLSQTSDKPKQEPLTLNQQAQEKDEPPVVSAISDSPIIVPKLPPKQSKSIEIVDPKTLRKEEGFSSSSMEKHMMAPSFVPASIAEVSLEEYPPESAVAAMPHQGHMVMPHVAHMLPHQATNTSSLGQSVAPYASMNQAMHILHPPAVAIQPHHSATVIHAQSKPIPSALAHHTGPTGVHGAKSSIVPAPHTMTASAPTTVAPPAAVPLAKAPYSATAQNVTAPQPVVPVVPKTVSQIMPAPQPQRPKMEYRISEIHGQQLPVLVKLEAKQDTETLNGPVTTKTATAEPEELKFELAASEKAPSTQESQESEAEITTPLLACIESISRTEEIKFTSTQAILHQSLMAKGQEIASSQVQEPYLSIVQEPDVAIAQEPTIAKVSEPVLTDIPEPALPKTQEPALANVQDAVLLKVRETALPKIQEPVLPKEPECVSEKPNEPLSVKAPEVTLADAKEFVDTKNGEPSSEKGHKPELAKSSQTVCVSNKEAEPNPSDHKTEQALKSDDSQSSSSEAKTDAEAEPAPVTDAKTDAPPAKPAAPVLQYHYSKDQWSPINPTGKKVYDRDFLLQLQNNPLSRRLPDNMQLLVSVVKSKSPEGLMPLPNLMASLRINTDAMFLPPFAKMVNQKGSGRDREQKKPNMLVKTPSMKGSISMPGPMSGNKAMFHLSLTRTDVKLNETENAWKPARKTVISDETQEVYRQFRGILNKLTPDNLNKLVVKVRELEINTQERLEGVIDLVFEKAIDEPGFSVTYANMCDHLSALKVSLQGENASGHVNFRILIINKCQTQFETTKKTHARVVELEKELAECTDAAKKKEILQHLDEENRRIRLRSVGNVRFIGELYKLKMLTSRIMIYCLNHLIERLEEENLECLCKLLSTIGEPLEQEAKSHLDSIFAELQKIVDHQAGKISSRVKFMIQDVILLRKRKWASKNVMDAQPKTIDQIQKEDEYRQRQIEIMAAAPLRGEYRGRDDGGARGKRDRDRRAPNNYDNWPASNQRTKYTVDTSKLKAATNSNKISSNIKLGPPQHSWNHGSGAKAPSLSSASLSQTTTTNNMYSALENVNVDPTTFRGSKEHTPNYHSKGASIERSTFNSRTEYSNVSKATSSPVARSSSGSRSGSERSEFSEVERESSVSAAAAESSSSEQLSDEDRRYLHRCVNGLLVSLNDEAFAESIAHHFRSCQHSSFVYETYTYALEKSPKTHKIIANALLHMVQNHALSRAHFLLAYTELLEFAPELVLDYPKVYDYLVVFIMPFLIHKQMTLYSLWDASTRVISEQHGHKFLRLLLLELVAEGAPEKWRQSGLRLWDWTSAEEAIKIRAEPALAAIFSESLEREVVSGVRHHERCPAEIQASLLLMMNLDRSVDAIRRYIQEFVGDDTRSDWFTRCLIQAVCENALFGRAGAGVVPRLNQDRMSKYIQMVIEYGADRESRDASCLLGVQQLLNRLEHPKGVTLEIFQYLSDHYIVHRDGFLAFAKNDQGPEGKGVLLKALVSFYTSLEVDNEDSCSED